MLGLVLIRPSPERETRSEKPAIDLPPAGARRAARFHENRGRKANKRAPPKRAQAAPINSCRTVERAGRISPASAKRSTTAIPSESIVKTANEVSATANNT